MLELPAQLGRLRAQRDTLGALADTLAGIDLAGPDGAPLGVNLLPADQRSQAADPWRTWNLGLAAVALLALAMAGCRQPDAEAPAAPSAPPPSAPAEAPAGTPDAATSGVVAKTAEMPRFQAKAVDGKDYDLASHRGQWVVVNFWATWCGPCFDAFPHLTEWHQDFKADGLVILGLTRYYGRADGALSDKASEIAFLKKFKVDENLPYDFLVADDQQSQMLYGATALPTAVLIDRKGVVRYVESGTNPSRIEEMRAMMLKLLAEK